MGRAPRKRSPLWRTLRTLQALGLFLIFALALVSGAVLHVGLPVSRGATARLVERFLDATFEGSFEIGAIERLSGGGLRARDLSAFDPDGRKVLSIDQLEADVDPLDLVRRILSSQEKLSIVIERVYLRGSEIQFLPSSERDDKGELRTHVSLADTFTPKKDTTKKAKSEPARPVRVWFPKIVLRDTYAHGAIAGSPPLEAQARLAIATLLATDEGVAVDVARFGLEASGLGGVDTTARGEVHVRVPGAIWGDVSGAIGNIPLEQKFRFEEGRIDVRGRYPRLEPSDLRPLLGSWPLDRALTAEVHIIGPADALTIDARVTPLQRSGAIASRNVQAVGSIQLAPHNHLLLRVTSHRLNLSEFLSTLPPSELDAESTVNVDWSGNGPVVRVESHVQPGRIAELATPQTEATAQWSKDGWNLSAELHGPSIAGTFEAAQKADAPLEFQARLYPTSIAQSVILSQPLSPLSGVIEGTAHGSLEGNTLSVSTNIDGKALQFPGIQVASAHLAATWTGPADAPLAWQGTSRLSTRGITLSGLGLTRLDIVQSGRLAVPRLELNGETAAQVQLSAKGTFDVAHTTLTQVSAELAGDEQPIALSAEKIRFGEDELEIRKFLMQSTGKIEGDLYLRGKGGRVEVQARGLSVSRISRALGLARGELEGDLDADIDLTLGDFSRGSVSIDVHEAAALGFVGLSVSARAQLDGKDLSGKVHAQIGGVGGFESTWDADLAGSPLDPESYSRAAGRFSVTAKDLDLSTLSLLLNNPGGIRAAGRASCSLELSRERGQAPRGSLSLTTHDLEMTLTQTDFTMRGVDLEWVSAVPESSDRLETALRLVDPFGNLLSLSGTLALPLERWSESAPSEDELLTALTSGALNVVALSPNRKVHRLPLFIPRPVEEGEVSMRAAVTGSLSEPDVSLVATGKNWFGEPLWATEPLNFHTNLRYRANRSHLLGSVTIERDENRVVSAQLDLNLNRRAWTAWLARRGSVPASPEPPQEPLWTGWGQAFLESTPLTLVSAFKEWGLSGSAQGGIRIDRQGLIPQITAELALRDATFRNNNLGDAHLEVETVESDLVAHLEMQDDSGTLRVTAESGIRATPLFIEENTQKVTRIAARAERYDSALLLPAMSDLFDEFSGPLFGRATAEIRRTGDPDSPFALSLAGDLRMDGGLITPSVLGTRLKDVHARIQATTNAPYTVIQLRDLRARAGSAAENLHGQGQLRLRNFALEDGSFSLYPDKMPLSTGGTHLADLSGAVLGRIGRVDDELRVRLVADELLAELAETGETALIELSENPSIQVLQELDRTAEGSAENAGTSVRLQLVLGQNVRLKNSLLDVRVRGTPEVRIKDDVAIAGAVELVRGGRFVVLGRTFVIERGLVLFDTQDASDPHLQAIASWKAPNGVVITATVGGTIKAPTLAWSSEPALPGGEADIIALVLGAGGGGGETSTGVGSTSLAIAANELSDVEGLEFYTTTHAQGGEGRVAGLNNSNWDSYTAAYQISDKLWFEGSFQQRSVGLNSEARPGVSGTLDWRFHPQWSARTEIGTLGAGLDMLWQYRY